MPLPTTVCFRSTAVLIFLNAVSITSAVVAQTNPLTQLSKGAAFPPFIAPAGNGDAWSSIVNGTVTDRHPAVGALLRIDSDGHAGNHEHCSGALIACRYMVTAAHCIKGSDEKSYLAWFQATGPLKVKRVDRDLRYHDCADPGSICSVADIAVIELDKPVEGIRSIPITRTTVVPAGDIGTIVGFGVTSGSGRVRDYGIKRRGTAQTSSCKQKIDKAGDSAWLCWKFLSNTTSNTCAGDSGGPYIASNGAVAGITSTGMGISGNCDVGDEAFDTRVSAFSDWLLERVGSELGSSTCGNGAQAGESDAPTVMVVNENYVPNGQGMTHELEVTSPAARLAVSAQGVGRDYADIRSVVIRLRRLQPVREWDVRCKSSSIANLAFCEIRDPEPGKWELAVGFESKNIERDQPFLYQVTATLYQR